MLPHDEHTGAYESTSGAMYDRPVDRFRRNLGSVFTDRVLWAVAGVVVLFFRSDEHTGAYESTSGAMYDRPVDRFRRNLGSVFTDRVLWAVAGVVVLFF